MLRITSLVACLALCVRCEAQTAARPMKQLLIVGEEKGYRHEAVSHAVATIERLGRETGLWTTTIRTDTEVLTKKKLEYNAKNLNNFDAVLFYSGGELEMDLEQKVALLSFVQKDEIYQMKDFSRDKVRILMRLDAAKLDLNSPRVHRKDLDFAVTWVKMYGKGRVYYSTLGHVEQNWDDPRIQKMYVDAIKWAMGLVDADVRPRPVTNPSKDAENNGAKN